MIKYMDSEVLGKKIKLDTETGSVTVQEKKVFGPRGYVTYSADEVQIIKETTGEIDPMVHRIKNVFDGVLVRNES